MDSLLKIKIMKPVNRNLVSYYNDRAREYEKVYLNPDEQEDLQKASAISQALFSKKTVFEIACGTGYWTEQISKTANSVYATDINESVIEIARKSHAGNNSAFAVADMFSITTNKKYEGLFGGFIWSHILLQDLDKFIGKIKEFIQPGAVIIFIDSNCVEGTNHDTSKLSEADEYGNTYQVRMLDNGSHHLVLKNFPTKDFIFQKLSAIATDFSFIKLKYYWIVSCRLSETGVAALNK
jgi:2-polyprenyl-3-methyl-5-hydroxy-6-metoxy-1,4-benzoquinol methylase